MFDGRKYRSQRTTHNLSKHPLYVVWQQMVQRCYNPSHKSYHNYGMRGIYIVPEWYTPGIIDNPGFIAFYNWAIENGYHIGLSIDRKDNDGPYAPWNCQWVTMIYQQNNKRTNAK